MKIIIENLVSIAIIILALIVISSPHITINPFRVKLNSPYLLIATILFLGSFIFLSAHLHQKGYKKGLKDGIDEALKIVNEQNKKTS